MAGHLKNIHFAKFATPTQNPYIVVFVKCITSAIMLITEFKDLFYSLRVFPY
ncbi:hypothetical protein NIES2100_12630 [Calothrix sp. NIES-2100]|nr:hypothetical protein NIES2100_12630 [Calothrix sp. NIES-2100]